MTDMCVANLAGGTQELWIKLFLGLKNITAMCMCRKSLIDENVKKGWYNFAYTRINIQLETLYTVDSLKISNKEQFNSTLTN
mmetsp:Transcript_17891/g.39357  ORF Transcript_17891/g.39357 Transcript_17891/m.39357 type:complete len:82 (-) Transcript_17891:2571-2816(-)